MLLKKYEGWYLYMFNSPSLGTEQRNHQHQCTKCDPVWENRGLITHVSRLDFSPRTQSYMNKLPNLTIKIRIWKEGKKLFLKIEKEGIGMN